MAVKTDRAFAFFLQYSAMLEITFDKHLGGLVLFCLLYPCELMQLARMCINRYTESFNIILYLSLYLRYDLSTFSFGSWQYRCIFVMLTSYIQMTCPEHLDWDCIRNASLPTMKHLTKWSEFEILSCWVSLKENLNYSRRNVTETKRQRGYRFFSILGSKRRACGYKNTISFFGFL